MIKSFKEIQKEHQIRWRINNISTNECGFQNGKKYEHIIPKNIWKETLWIDIRKELSEYLYTKKIQHHTGVHNLLSSWILCANLYFPVRINESLRKLFLDFIKQKISDEITCIKEVELEFAFPKDDSRHPSRLLGENDGIRGSGQTSPDIAFIVKTKTGQGIIMTECKYTEHSFYPCSVRRLENIRQNNIIINPQNCFRNGRDADYKSFCYLKKILERKYWNYLTLSEFGKNSLTRCPAATSGYQLFRQQALAEGIAKKSAYSTVVSSVAFDGRNTNLINCLKSTGIEDFRSGWSGIFDGKVIFKTWTHQEWIQYVRGNQKNGEFENWLKYLNERYGY